MGGGAVEFEGVAAVNLGSSETVGSRRRGAEELAQQSEDVRRPLLALVTARDSRLPVALSALGASGEVVGKENIEAAATEAEFGGGIRNSEGLSAEASHDITGERSRVAAAQLLVVFSSGHRRAKGPRAHSRRSLRSATAAPGMRCPALPHALSCFACPLSCFDRTTTEDQRRQ